MLPLAESETGQPPVRRGKTVSVLKVTGEPDQESSNGNTARLIKNSFGKDLVLRKRHNTCTATGTARYLHSTISMQVS